MGFLEEIIKIKWNSRIKKYYENLGYVFTKMGDEFEVNIKHLTKGSSMKIKVECDSCFKESYVRYTDYVNHNHNKKYYCRKCSLKLFGSKNANNTKLNTTITFAQWGINNLGEDFLEKYWSDKNTVSPCKISYGSGKKVWIKCQEKDYHEDYKITPTHFINGKRCPYCVGKEIHPKDSMGQYIIDNYGQDFLDNVWSDKNKKSAFKYAPNTTNIITWKCEKEIHDEYIRDGNLSVNYEFRCPNCVQEKYESILQEKVRLHLESLTYTILHEEKCTIIPRNPKTNRNLPFDNEIKELKLICEVNGQQHYKINGFHYLQAKKNNTTLEQELYNQQVKDRYKRIKAIQQGYYFLEIPYWTDDKEETWKQLIDNKIKESLLNLN